MDQFTTNILTYIAFGVGIASSVIAAINHQRLRSSCCGRRVEISLDIEKTSPKHKPQEDK
jgi:lipopolysaccharide export system protein LptA